MRSAWSPTRSMSFDTFFEVLPSCLLALPSDLAIDCTSSSEERGSDTPSTLVRLLRLFSASPPATPTAAAPIATAGPLALPTACAALLAVLLNVSTTPFPFWLAGVLRLRVLRWGLLAPPLERDDPLLAREAVLRLRVDAADLERLAFAPVDFAREDFAAVDFFAAVGFAAVDFALVLDPDPLVEVLLRCPLRALDLLLAIPDPSLTRFWGVFFMLDFCCPTIGRNNPTCRALQARVLDARPSG